MNNIQILEDFIKGKIEPDKLGNYKGGYKMGFFYTKNLQKAIENLIQENKELKENIEQQKFEINCLNSDIKNMYHKEAVISIIEDEFDLSRDEVIEIIENY